jgi:hypothetical protein
MNLAWLTTPFDWRAALGPFGHALTFPDAKHRAP